MARRAMVIAMICVASCLSTAFRAQAQSEQRPTLSETVKYLAQKVKKAGEYQELWNEGCLIGYRTLDSRPRRQTFFFEPKQMNGASVKITRQGINIQCVRASCVSMYEDREHSKTTQINIVFVEEDLERAKKGLEHLLRLCGAPFLKELF